MTKLKPQRPLIKPRLYGWRIVLFVLSFGLLAFGATAIVSAATTSTTISSIIIPVLGLSTSTDTVNVNINPTGTGAQTIAGNIVTVNTSDPTGYTLQLADADSDSALVSGLNTIPASSGTQTSPTVMAADSWGYRVDGVGGFGAGPTTGQGDISINGSLTFAAVPSTSSPSTLKSTSSTATNDTTTVWYAVAAATNQAAGTYTDNVTYTAIAN